MCRGLLSRARASGEELAESLRDVAPERIGVGATGSLEGVWVCAHLGQSATLDWRGYDPARADRYFGAVQLWLNVLTDLGVQFNEIFDVQAAYVYGSISVLDDRDLETYRAELVGVLEKAGYTDPLVVVAAAPVPAS